MSAKEIVTRGDLPHWYVPGHPHFITYRLANTIPAIVLEEWQRRFAEKARVGAHTDMPSDAHRMRLHKQFFAEYDRYLDMHRERDWLSDPRVAEVIRENLYHHDGVKFQLLAWCVMHNHVHVVLQPLEVASTHTAEAGSFGYGEIADRGSPLSSIMHSLKSYTANRANEILGRSGQFWQHESYDHWVRDLDELNRIVDYVIGNPVEAGLCRRPIEWRFSSAYDRFQRDSSECGLVGWLKDDWHV